MTQMNMADTNFYSWFAQRGAVALDADIKTSVANCKAEGGPTKCRFHSKFVKKTPPPTQGSIPQAQRQRAQPQPRTTAGQPTRQQAASSLAEDIKKAHQIGNYKDSKGVLHDTRVMKATDKPCSKEFNDIIDRLLAGDATVSDDMIEATPEWKYGKKQLHNLENERIMAGKPAKTRDIRTVERENLRASIEDKLSGELQTEDINDAVVRENGGDGKPYKVQSGRRLDIVIGLPASGKSTVICRDLLRKNQSRLVDSDEVKKLLEPDFAGGLGADTVHEESKDITNRILSRAMRKGDNIVHPILGTHSTQVADLIQTARKAGYSVNLHFNQIDINKAKGRMLERYLSKNRFLPLSLYAEANGKIEDTFRECRTLCDSSDGYISDTINPGRPMNKNWR